MQFKPIAYVHSPYKQKFAVPRQPGLVPQALGEIHFTQEYCDINALRSLEQFSHLWLIFVFHQTMAAGWSPTVAPPRLQGKEKIGVFASRSMFRPNPIGLSVVEFVGFKQQGKNLVLQVKGLDLIDGTPLLDIKPYLPYADAITDATGGYAKTTPAQNLTIAFSTVAQQQLSNLQSDYPQLRQFITSVLQQDPRPAQHVRREQSKDYAMLLYDLNISWLHSGKNCEVISIERTTQNEFPDKTNTDKQADKLPGKTFTP